MIYDVFTYNGERDMLRLHLSILSPVVNKFIIVEAKTTFTRRPKPLYFFQHQRYFREWWNKIEYHVIDEDYSPEELSLAKASPNTQGASHWVWEFLQKESIMKAIQMQRPNDDDTFFIGDVDEIWDADAIRDKDLDTPLKLKLKVYAYYLNNRSDEQFWGTLVAPYADLKGKTLNHLRSTEHNKTDYDAGWHFTSQGGLKEVQRKLNDSYTAESYNTPDVQQNLTDRVAKGIDYLGRPFQFRQDETEWPRFLTEHRAKFSHLLK